MRIKKKYNINGVKWSVSFDLVNPNNSGECYTDEKKIKLDPKLSANDIDETFLHEFLHAVFHENGVYQIISADAEELVVTCASKALKQVITKSKKLPCFAPKPGSV